MPILPLILIIAGIAVVLVWRSGHVQEFAAYSKAQVPEQRSDSSRSTRTRPRAVEDLGEATPPPADPQRQAAADARARSLQIVAQQRAALRAFIQQIEPFERELRSLMNAQMVGVNYPDYQTRVQRLADAFSLIPDGAGVPSFTIQDGIGNLKTGNGSFLGYAVSVRPAASAVLQSRITILDAWKTGITHPEFGGMDIVRDGFKHNFDYFFSRNDTARSILNYSDDEWMKLFPQ